tara:strand:+ start:525 stop:890 length:366 start_codon:yes stop_codon:yes gene_type:complete
VSTLKVDSIGKTSGSTQDTMAGLTKVWLNYNQVNDTTNDTFNVSSILDSSTGVFIATFSNNMNNTTYTASLSSSQAANEATQAQYAVGTRATNSCGYDTENISSVNTDLAQNDSLIHGDLA